MHHVLKIGIAAFIAGLPAASANGDSVQAAQSELPFERPRLQTDGPREVLRPPKATFTWRIPKRYDRSWNAWNPRLSRYDPSFVDPERWSVVLDACASSGRGSRITEYHWTVRGVREDNAGFKQTTRACRYFARGRFPELGSYEVTLSIETAAGSTDVTRRTIELKDWVIVSLGDSMSSGEGNPDRPGQYHFSPGVAYKARCAGAAVRRNKTVRWQDRRCHRSALSGPARAAEWLEDRDHQSSVTFLSFACSGAEIRHLFRDRYAGQEPPPDGPADVPPQIDALRRDIGDRRIDALIFSAGINDLSFSDEIKHCVTNVFDEWSPTAASAECGRGLFDTLDALPARYRALNRALRRLDVAEIYVLDYPVNVLENAKGEPNVCECLDLGGDVDLKDREVALLTQVGVRLNRQIGFAASQDEVEWNLVHGMPEILEGGGYCAPGGARLFRRRIESIRMQGPEDGAMHPNVRGHHRLGGLLIDALVLDPPEPQKRITVTFEKIKLGNVKRTTSRPATVRLRVFQRERRPFHDFYNPFRTRFIDTFNRLHERGTWVEFPEDEYQFTFEVHPSPAPPRYITDFGVEAKVSGKIVGQPSHAGKNDYGTGRQLVETPERVREYVGLQYRIDVDPVIPTSRDVLIQGDTLKLRRPGSKQSGQRSRPEPGVKTRNHRDY